MKYNVKEAAQRLGVSPRCVYSWMEKGQFIGPFFDSKSQIDGKVLNKMAKEYVRNKP
jgi:predicted site-specific integrase-resolvase